MKKTSFSIALAAVLAAAASPATAGTAAVPFRARISTAGLDLRTAEGQHGLLARAEKAADRICGPADNVVYRGELLEACRARFFDAARDRIAGATRVES